MKIKKEKKNNNNNNNNNNSNNKKTNKQEKHVISDLPLAFQYSAVNGPLLQIVPVAKRTWWEKGIRNVQLRPRSCAVETSRGIGTT